MNAFKSLPFWGQLIVTVVLMGAIGFGGYSFWPNIDAQTKEVVKLEKKLNDLNAEIQKGLNLEKKLPELKREIANLEEQLNQLKTIIPPVRDDSALIQKLEQLAKQSRLNISSITPQRLRQKDFYDEYPLLIVVQANYHDLAKFFDRMARLPRIFNVSGVKINQAIDRSTTIAANFTAVTFIYQEERSTQPPAGGKGKPAKPKRGGQSKDSLKGDL